MILTHHDLQKCLASGKIVVSPIIPGSVGTNSIDVHLGKYLMKYDDEILDAAKLNYATIWEIPEEGYILKPNTLYLAATLEYTETLEHIPVMEGKSSVGRLGLHVHVCAGFGDLGFKGHWTLEMQAVQPIRIYRGMPIGQIAYYVPSSLLEKDYQDRGSYTEISDKPVASKLWKKAGQWHKLSPK
jgi:dCTP deaminase